jgi:uncharacterized iron-regulated membrane protein
MYNINGRFVKTGSGQTWETHTKERYRVMHLCIYAGIIVIFFALSSFAFVFATFSDMVQEARDKQEARAVARHAAAADAAAQEEEEKEAAIAAAGEESGRETGRPEEDMPPREVGGGGAAAGSAAAASEPQP